jgi:hypothetical protein
MGLCLQQKGDFATFLPVMFWILNYTLNFIARYNYEQEETLLID